MMATTKKDLEAALVRLVKAVEAERRTGPYSLNVQEAVYEAKFLLPDVSWTD